MTKGVTLPMWAAKLMGVVIERVGPKGMEYARFSIDSHFTRNYLYVKRNHPEKLAQTTFLNLPSALSASTNYRTKGAART
jgi:hypothetical protein